MKDIGIFVICTGSYIRFLEPLNEGLQTLFLPKHKKSVYAITDNDWTPEGTIRVYHKHEPWPNPTLFRYHWITEFVDREKIKHDYYYYLDADMLIVKEVGDEILGKIVATRHPGFWNCDKYNLGHEQRFISQAFTPKKYIQKYYAGAMNGGSGYLDMARQIIKWIDKDQKYGFTTCWNDESYLNKALAITHLPDVELSPSYCYPMESALDIKMWGLKDIDCKIACLYKNNYGFTDKE